MRIRVSFYAEGKGLRKKSLSLPETRGPISIRELLSDVSKNGGTELAELASTMSQHGPRRTILVAVNGRNIKSLQGMDTLLHDEDSLSVLPVVAGG